MAIAPGVTPWRASVGWSDRKQLGKGVLQLGWSGKAFLKMWPLYIPEKWGFIGPKGTEGTGTGWGTSRCENSAEKCPRKAARRPGCDKQGGEGGTDREGRDPTSTNPSQVKSMEILSRTVTSCEVHEKIFLDFFLMPVQWIGSRGWDKTMSQDFWLKNRGKIADFLKVEKWWQLVLFNTFVIRQSYNN